jgi:diphthamide synthase (EF-2-diphthine--ammonia ligase)
MKTMNSISGGKTSAYIAAHYPADYDIFALVRIEDKNCLFPDAKIRQEVEDRIHSYCRG